MRHWILAIRPKTLIAAIAPVLIGTGLAKQQQAISSILFVFTLLTALLIQILTNLANDFWDFKKGADNEKRIGPVRVMQAGLITESQMKMALVLISFLIIGCSLPLIYQGGFPFVLLTLLSIVLAFAYTTGPFPLAYLGLGEIFVLLFFGLIATTGTFYLQVKEFSYLPCILGLCIGMLANSLLVINNIRDYKEDKINQKKTLAVRFGLLFGKIELIYCYIIAATALLYFSAISNQLYLCLALIPLIKPLIEIMQKSAQDTIGIGFILPHAAKAFTLFTYILTLLLLI